jgi:hypothetical protein
VDIKASAEVAKTLANNASLTHGIDRQIKLGRTVLDIKATTRATGTVNIENLVFSPRTMAIEAPFLYLQIIRVGEGSSYHHL